MRCRVVMPCGASYTPGRTTLPERQKRRGPGGAGGRLAERCAQDVVLLRVLAADVDEDVLRLDRVRGDQAALDQPVRDLEHDLAVLERPRFRLVGVDGDVDRLRHLVRRGDEARLPA